MHINIEFKARCDSPERIREILRKEYADYRGRDNQIDIYFDVPNGRLKLRIGDFENYLIGYKREDIAGIKQSDVYLFHTSEIRNLEKVLIATLHVKAVVEKQRDIYFIENVKFHVDEVKNLGSFIEVEAIDKKGDLGIERLRKQCEKYRKLLGVREEDMVAESYSDLIFRKRAIH